MTEKDYKTALRMITYERIHWRGYNGIDMLMMKIKEDISAELADILEMSPGR